MSKVILFFIWNILIKNIKKKKNRFKDIAYIASIIPFKTYSIARVKNKFKE